MIKIEHFTFNAFQTRCSVVWDEGHNCVFVDPGCSSEQELEALTSFVASKGLRPLGIMLTHCHFDHIYGMSSLSREYNIPVYTHHNELPTLEKANPYICQAFGLPLPNTFPIAAEGALAESGATAIFVKEGDIIEIGAFRFEVIETPGHTTGGVCFLERTEKVLFSGDTLFAGAIGRTDQPGGDYDMIMKSIFEKLMHLDRDICVIPGHGPVTDIATERMTNPFLLPFNEPYEE